jgi:hypothetical protein
MGSSPTEVFRIDLHSKIKHGTWRIVFGWFWNMFLMLFSNGNHTLKVYQPIFLCQHLHFLCLVITSIPILSVKDDQHHHENPHSCDFLRYPYLLDLHVCWAPYATLLGLQKSNPNVCLVKSGQIPEVAGQTNSIHINVVKTIVISPIFDSLYQPFMVILGIVYYCFKHIHYCWLHQATPGFLLIQSGSILSWSRKNIIPFPDPWPSGKPESRHTPNTLSFQKAGLDP